MLAPELCLHKIIPSSTQTTSFIQICSQVETQIDSNFNIILNLNFLFSLLLHTEFQKFFLLV